MEDLKRKRASVKANLTRFSNYLEAGGKTDNANVIESWIKNKESILDKYDEIQMKIEELVAAERDKDAIALEEAEREQFENTYFSVMGKAREMVEKSRKTSTEGTNNRDNNHSAPSHIAGINLPKMSLATFDGDCGTWVKFRDMFKSVIHENNSLSDIQKFNYLNSVLKGEAANVIAEVSISEEDYQEAWKTLCERYDDTSALLLHHVERLHAAPVLTRDSDKDLRQLIDNTKVHLRALKKLGQETEHWDILIVYILSTKLSPTIRREWERERMHLKENTTLQNMYDFLEEYCKFLKNTTTATKDSSQDKRSNAKDSSNKSNQSKRNEQTKSYAATTKTCPMCNGPHGLYACQQFRELAVADRIKKVQELRVCFNCLSSGHQNKRCKFGPCRVCNKKHNSLLHLDQAKSSNQLAVATNRDEMENAPSSDQHQVYLEKDAQRTYLAARDSARGTSYVLLGTASVYLIDRYGQRHLCRALLDSGSQVHIMTKDCCKRLKLDRENSSICLSGIEQGEQIIRQKVTVRMNARTSNYSATITCLLLDKISDNMPSNAVKAARIDVPKGIELADPEYDLSRPIDLLIGAALFYELLSVGQIKLRNDQPVWQKTILGWIATGNINFTPKIQKATCNLVSNTELNDQLKQFWEIEHCFSEPESPLILKQNHCEQHFIQNTRQDQHGRYVVSIPFKENIEELGNSEDMALKRFFHLEKKLAKNEDLRKQYIDFMREYEELGHMTEISADELEATKGQPNFYLPHHAVFKETSTTTKLRVVFDGSAKASNGLSRNEAEHVGPVVQEELFCIVIRTRLYKYAMQADIAKMYRMIKVPKEDRKFQRIVWREDPSLPIRHIELNTVTYGTSSAAYLATRSLQDIGYKNQVEYPLASKVICRDFYVDDLYTGADTIEEAVRLKNDLAMLLSRAGMELRKWASNEPQIINNQSQVEISPQGEYVPKTLGLIWDTYTDKLKYRVSPSKNNKISKRTILSIIAQIFDPLGLVGPAIIQAKIILQKLWSLNITWDESVPQDIHESWIHIYDQMMAINTIAIPRCVMLNNYAAVELHGFCDASEKAYGACIYVCTQNQGGRRAAQLFCAKSRVAPLKSVSLPRLELLGAVLLAQLTKKIVKACNLTIEKWNFWTDSTVVLAWLDAPSTKWKTFVANRTAEIRELTNSNWRHVQSESNPADLISRGVSAAELRESSLWWHGPVWLAQNKEHWPPAQELDVNLAPEQKRHAHTLVAQEIKNIDEPKIKLDKEFNKVLFERTSSFSHLVRTVAFILRFIDRCKTKARAKKDLLRQVENEPHPNRFIALRTNELLRATQRIIILAQRESFSEEIHKLKTGTKIDKCSKLKQLNPYLDEDGTLRVGGRLDNATIPYEQKHPILLDPKHKLTKLLIQFEHRRLLHAGSQTVLLSLRKKYWPLTGKRGIKGVIGKCITCFRANPTDLSPMMGNLPGARVNPTRPFYNCGVDYAGPFLIKEKTRSRVSIKAYVCIFVCFVTKATHIELAIDLSAEAFLNCLRRFISRRGRCANIYSDNGTNFVGANSELKELKNLLKDNNFRQQIVDFGNSEHINWHFIPPRAPHFGGLWEGAVKSAKFHLKRVIGETRLTYEEFSTILTQVEACLNSRPLQPLSNDPNDLTPLTPSHFLIGDLLTGLPEGDLREIKESRLNRYQHLQQMLQHFWQRWQLEYLPHLQKRQKWNTNTSSNIKVDTMVLIKEDNTPPMQWPLGRVIDLHPGKDKIVRVVSIRTAKGIIKRPLVKICPLPIEDLANDK